jgi:hypothetical protein
MDFVEFLRHSSVLDWLVLFLTAALVILALIMLIVARSRKPFFLVFAMAGLPLAGGLFSTFVKYQQLERALALAGSDSSDVVERAQAEAWIISYVGIAGAVIIAIFGLIGVITKRAATA